MTNEQKTTELARLEATLEVGTLAPATITEQIQALRRDLYNKDRFADAAYYMMESVSRALIEVKYTMLIKEGRTAFLEANAFSEWSDVFYIHLR